MGYVLRQLFGRHWMLCRQGDFTAMLAVGAALGTNLISNHLEALKAKPQKEQPAYLAELLEKDQALREDTQKLITELNSLSVALNESKAEDRVWLQEKLNAELEKWGYGIKVEGDVRQSIINTGNQNTFTVTFVEKQEITHKHFAAPAPSEVDAYQNRQKIDLYLDKLINECQVLPMAPLGGDSTGDLEITLDQVYIALDTLTKRDWQSKTEKENYLKENNIPEYTSGYEQRPVATLEAAQKEERMVLLGDPGSGKSTFIKKTAGTAAREWKSGQPGHSIGQSLFPSDHHPAGDQRKFGETKKSFNGKRRKRSSEDLPDFDKQKAE